MLVWCCHIDDFDVWISAHFVNGRIGLGREIGRKALPRFGARIGGGYERDTWVACKRRQHHGERAAQPSNADAQLSHGFPNSTRQRPLIKLAPISRNVS